MNTIRTLRVKPCTGVCQRGPPRNEQVPGIVTVVQLHPLVLVSEKHQTSTRRGVRPTLTGEQTAKIASVMLSNIFK